MNIQIRLDKMIYGSRVLGRYNGKVVFVDADGLEGELVDIQIAQEKKDYIIGNILKVQEPSPQRVASICKYGQICGGCQWQHIDYSAQLRFKEQIFREQLIRIGGFKQPQIMPVIGIKNVHFLCHDLKQAVSRMTTPQFDSVILNPPRDGVEKHILHWLIETKPARIIYISCNPTTLSRDMKILCQGGYSLTIVQPVDMFPQTYHVESIALLERE